jgi:3'-phosphoadenosine 5'-phosphosulfate sulfotransferase (PAPS reductase)/FAD synthetase
MADDERRAEMHHVVMFSGGIGSWATAGRVAAEYGTESLTLLFADTLMEDEDTYQFLEAAAANVGGDLVRLRDGRDIWQVFRDVKFLGNTRIDPCSRVLKRELMRKWVDARCDPKSTTIYVGIDWTEAHRAERYARYWQPYEVRCPLTEPPYLTKQQMLDAAGAEGLPSQRLYQWGFHHANCGGGCVKAGQAQFELLLRRLPDRYRWWEEREQEIRAELGKDITILRDRYVRNGREVVKPITLRAFRERLEAQPGLFDAEEWGACACTEPSDEELVA